MNTTKLGIHKRLALEFSSMNIICISAFIIGFLLCGCSSENNPIKEGYKKINGGNHFYKIAGSGEPYIMLHGGPGMYHDELLPFFLDFAKSNNLMI